MLHHSLVVYVMRTWYIREGKGKQGGMGVGGGGGGGWEHGPLKGGGGLENMIR